MKKGWEVKKLGDVAKHSLGKMLDKSKNKGEPKPYLRNLNVRWAGFDLSDVLEMRFQPQEFERYTVVKGDVLVCEGGYPGRAAIWEADEPIYFQKALHRVRFHEPERNRWFVYYLLFRDLEGTLKQHFNGVGIQHFTGEALAQFEIPIPPLPEQQRIVGVLDEAFASLDIAQANTEKNRQNARALFESHLQSIFTQRGVGWVEKTIGETCVLRSGTSVPVALERSAGEFPYVKVADMNYAGNEMEIVTSSRFLDSADIGKNAVIPIGATIFPKRGGSILTNKKRLTAVSICADLNIMAVIPGEQLLPRFLHYYFINVDMRKIGSGSSIPQINNYDIEPRLIAFPESKAMQQTLIHELDTIASETQRLEGIYQRKLDALAVLKKSLLQQAFSGQL